MPVGKRARKRSDRNAFRRLPCQTQKPSVLPALLQKLVGELFIFCRKFGGKFCGRFLNHQIKAQKIRENFGAFFVRKLISKISFRANFALQTCHFDPPWGLLATTVRGSRITTADFKGSYSHNVLSRMVASSQGLWKKRERSSQKCS